MACRLLHRGAVDSMQSAYAAEPYSTWLFSSPMLAMQALVGCAAAAVCSLPTNHEASYTMCLSLTLSGNSRALSYLSTVNCSIPKAATVRTCTSKGMHSMRGGQLGIWALTQKHGSSLCAWRPEGIRGGQHLRMLHCVSHWQLECASIRANLIVQSDHATRS